MEHREAHDQSAEARPARTLLLNFVYYNAVGHTAEALKYAKGFAEANAGLDVYLAHRADAPIELAEGCDWIRGTYPVEMGEFREEQSGPARSLTAIPRDWDWLIENNLIDIETGDARSIGRTTEQEIGSEEAPMLNYLRAGRAYFTARCGSGTLYPKLDLPSGLNYTPNATVRIEVPASAVADAVFAGDETGGLALGVMLGGSAGYSHYPSVRTWTKILQALEESSPSCRLYLTGVTRSRDGRTSSTYTQSNINTILRGLSNATAVYDVGLWDQLAVIERCDAFISPHTGFAFLALCVGTPWVAISGGDWAEYFFNDVPFYSVLPDNPEYPYEGTLDKYRQWTKIPCMEPQKLEAKIPEIVDAVRFVASPDCTFDAAVERHERNIARANVRRVAIPIQSSF